MGACGEAGADCCAVQGACVRVERLVVQVLLVGRRKKGGAIRASLLHTATMQCRAMAV